jgi:hypothetical protein
MQSTWITGRDLRIDTPIFTADSRYLGAVKEISRNAFKVDAPMARDYWLSCDAVRSIDRDRVVLDVPEDDLDDVKHGEPRDESIPREYRARDFDETWRETDTDYTGPDYLDPSRNWERSPREPDFSYGSWERNRAAGTRQSAWDEPREPFYRDSNPRGYREPRGESGGRRPVEATYQDDDRWSQGRNEFTRVSGTSSRYRSPAGVEGAVPRYDQERGWGYQGQGGWNTRFASPGAYSEPRSTRPPSGSRRVTYTGQPGRGYDRAEWVGTLWYDTEAPSGYSGRGPRSYSRPDDSICDEVCERLTYAGDVDATDIDVKVRNGEVILKGKVEDRRQRRQAEDIAHTVSGVRDVRNDLKARSSTTGRSGDESSMYLV